MESQAQNGLIPGTAEYAALYLTGHGLGCPHHPKYSIIETQSPKYPSKVGLFYNSSPSIGYLDTETLCIDCCEAIIPEGFSSWSLFARLAKVSQGTKPPKRWLDPQPMSSEMKLEDCYPALVQCGTEAPSAVASQSQAIIIPMPLEHPETRVAWQWLQHQRKPFYIDHLHLIRGWRPVAERNAVMDSPIAEENGIQFILSRNIKPKKPRFADTNTTEALTDEKTKGSTKTKQVVPANGNRVTADTDVPSLIGGEALSQKQETAGWKEQGQVTVCKSARTWKKLY